ncbi:NAD(P)/FAD-dependent oxidoreductase [Amorphus sp. MBR-141]
MQTHDVIVVGGSFAGLSAALTLGRARLDVLVIDAGLPRNRYASASHGFLGADGDNPAAILERARAQLAPYRGVRMQAGQAASARRGDEGGFVVEMDNGETARAGRLVLATGVTDILPDVPGLAARWGESVIHCPFCHGYEFGGGPLGVLASKPVSLMQARIIPQWGPTTLFVNGAVEIGAEDRADLLARGVSLEETQVAALEGKGQTVEAVRLVDGRAIQVVGLYVAPELGMTSGLATDLGCATDETPLGRFVTVGEDRQTSVPGVYAVGDMARMQHAVTLAVADGFIAATSIVHSRMFG